MPAQAICTRFERRWRDISRLSPRGTWFHAPMPNFRLPAHVVCPNGREGATSREKPPVFLPSRRMPYVEALADEAHRQ